MLGWARGLREGGPGLGLPCFPGSCLFRVSSRAGSRTGRSPAGVAGAAGVLEAAGRDPDDRAAGGQKASWVWLRVRAPGAAPVLAGAWLRSSLRVGPRHTAAGHGAVRAGGGINQEK